MAAEVPNSPLIGVAAAAGPALNSAPLGRTGPDGEVLDGSTTTDAAVPARAGSRPWTASAFELAHALQAKMSPQTAGEWPKRPSVKRGLRTLGR